MTLGNVSPIEFKCEHTSLANAQLQTVVNIIKDFSTWNKWDQYVERVELEKGQEFKEGSTFHFTPKVGIETANRITKFLESDKEFMFETFIETRDIKMRHVKKVVDHGNRQVSIIDIVRVALLHNNQADNYYRNFWKGVVSSSMDVSSRLAQFAEQVDIDPNHAVSNRIEVNNNLRASRVASAQQ